MKKLLIFLGLIFITQAKAQIITTVAGNGIWGYTGDGGQATAAELNEPDGLVFDGFGNLYIVDDSNNVIRKINTMGVISTIAGNGTLGYGGDGGQATAAELHYPADMTFDISGNIYFTDSHNNRIRKINTAGIISTFAGNGTQGYSGDGGQATAAELYYPNGLAFDSFGNLYFADYANNRIRMVNTAGIISTISGNGSAGYSGDGGQATAAELWKPVDLIIDNSDNLYIADALNSRVRKIDTAGIITTIAGNGTYGYSGDGGQATAAELNIPISLVFDASNNLYVADFSNSRVRMINTTGIITTVAGTGAHGYSGDGGIATLCELFYPDGLIFDNSGNLYISDTYNNRVRKITSMGTTNIEQYITNNSISIYPNPTSSTIQIAGVTNQDEIKIYDVLGNEVLPSKQTTIDVSSLPSGVYFVHVGASTQKFVVQH